MIHVMYAISIAGAMMSICSWIMSLIAFRRFNKEVYRYLGLISSTVFLMGVLYAVIVYMDLLHLNLAYYQEITWFALIFLCESFSFYLIQRSFYRIMSVRFTPKKRIIHAAIASLPFLGFTVTVFIFGHGWNIYLWKIKILESLQLVVYVYILIRYLKRISSRELIFLIKALIVILCVCIPPYAVQGSSWKDIEGFFSFFGAQWPFINFLLFFSSLFIFHYFLKELMKPHSDAGEEIDRSILLNRGLTDREIEVVELLIKRRSNREIGAKLFISIATVKTHVHHVFDKLEIGTRGELLELLAGLIR
jgi:DNA-binding CsgD family transcriptional regulator